MEKIKEWFAFLFYKDNYLDSEEYNEWYAKEIIGLAETEAQKEADKQEANNRQLAKMIAEEIENVRKSKMY